MEATKRWYQSLSAVSTSLITASVVVGVLTVIVAAQDKPSQLAVGLLQAIALVLGTVGSFVFGRDATRENVEVIRATEAERLRLPARSAFRRVRNLWKALGRQQAAVREQAERLSELTDPATGTVAFEHARTAFIALEYMVIEQMGTVDDALDDWRDLVPDEVEMIEKAGEDKEKDDE